MLSNLPLLRMVSLVFTEDIVLYFYFPSLKIMSDLELIKLLNNKSSLRKVNLITLNVVSSLVQPRQHWLLLLKKL